MSDRLPPCCEDTAFELEQEIERLRAAVEVALVYIDPAARVAIILNEALDHR